MQVRKKDTGRIYAMKSIRKGWSTLALPPDLPMHLMRRRSVANIASRPGEITHILAERTVLALVHSPFIVGLKFSFQTADKLYLVMPFSKWLGISHLASAAYTLFSQRRGIVPSPPTRRTLRAVP